MSRRSFATDPSQGNPGRVATDALHHDYPYLRGKFVDNPAGARLDSPTREEIVRRFEGIDQEIPIGTTPSDGLVLAEMLCSLEAEGAIVECGCFAGASAAKLSILASHLGRRLHVFDSFEGLPTAPEGELHDLHTRRDASTHWLRGKYAGSLEEVRANIARHGEPEVCTFVRGWFENTLVEDHLPQAIAMVFSDVDLASSARTTLLRTWPRITDGGVFASHDIGFLKVLQALMDEALWRQLGDFPPILFGAGFGISNGSPNLGYFVKGRQTSTEYLKALTLDK